MPTHPLPLPDPAMLWTLGGVFLVVAGLLVRANLRALPPGTEEGDGGPGAHAPVSPAARA
jgi:hypothetical protein